MKIEYYKANELDRNVKCSVHKSGKLGFSDGAIKKLGLSTDYSILLGKNSDDTTDENLYMVVLKEQREDAFKLIKSGEYFYANTKPLFDKLEIDYQNLNKTIIFDIKDIEIENEKIYKLVKREVEKKTKD